MARVCIRRHGGLRRTSRPRRRWRACAGATSPVTALTSRVPPPAPRRPVTRPSDLASSSSASAHSTSPRREERLTRQSPPSGVVNGYLAAHRADVQAARSTASTRSISTLRRRRSPGPRPCRTDSFRLDVAGGGPRVHVAAHAARSSKGRRSSSPGRRWASRRPRPSRSPLSAETSTTPDRAAHPHRARAGVHAHARRGGPSTSTSPISVRTSTVRRLGEADREVDGEARDVRLADGDERVALLDDDGVLLGAGLRLVGRAAPDFCVREDRCPSRFRRQNTSRRRRDSPRGAACRRARRWAYGPRASPRCRRGRS